MVKFAKYGPKPLEIIDSYKLAEKIVALFENINWSDSVYDFIIWGSLASGYKHRDKNDD